MLQNIAAGFVSGILSGFGIGGGSLLMLWLTMVAGLSQKGAQGINLLYFLPTALSAILVHHKRGMIRWQAVWPAVLGGCLVAAGAAGLAMWLDMRLLRRLFGGFLLIVGFLELRRSFPRREPPLYGRLRR